MPELTSADLLLRLGLAALLGGAIGTERELRDHEAGLRTHMLVALGAAGFTLVSAHGWQGWAFSTASGVVFDPTRIAAQVVSGIGFLGAGAILRHGVTVKGLTTAATLWVVAAIGMAAGAGYYTGAALTTAVVLLTLWPIRVAERRMLGAWRQQRGRLVVETVGDLNPRPILDAIEARGVGVASFDLERTEGGRRLSVTVRLDPGDSPAWMVTDVMEMPGVTAARWER